MFFFNGVSIFGAAGGFIAVVVILIVFLGTSKKNGGTTNGTRNTPTLIVEAVLVAKRMEVRNNSTGYYMTFQVESGDRMEFPVNGKIYGQYAEADYGKLTFKGDRFIAFERMPYLTNH